MFELVRCVKSLLVCVWVCLVESDLSLNSCFFIVLVLVLYAGYVYICLQNITIFPSFSASDFAYCRTVYKCVNSL